MPLHKPPEEMGPDSIQVQEVRAQMDTLISPIFSWATALPFTEPESIAGQRRKMGVGRRLWGFWKGRAKSRDEGLPSSLPLELG